MVVLVVVGLVRTELYAVRTQRTYGHSALDPFWGAGTGGAGWALGKRPT